MKDASSHSAASLSIAESAPDKAQQRRFQKRLNQARIAASAELRTPLGHVGLGMTGLALVQAARVVAWCGGERPAASVYIMQTVSVWDDIFVFLCCLPLVFGNWPKGYWVEAGCAGTFLTLMLTAVIIDGIALAGSLFQSVPSATNVLSVPFLRAFLGPWNCSLVGSFAFELSIFACWWRVYRGLRVSGLHPPDLGALMREEKLPTREEVSPLEVVCESEEVALLEDCGDRGCYGEKGLCTKDGCVGERCYGERGFAVACARYGMEPANDEQVLVIEVPKEHSNFAAHEASIEAEDNVDPVFILPVVTQLDTQCSQKEDPDGWTMRV